MKDIRFFFFYKYIKDISCWDTKKETYWMLKKLRRNTTTISSEETQTINSLYWLLTLAILQFDKEVQNRRAYPLRCPVALSIVSIASQRSVRGTQWGGYLNRATSKMRTISLPAWYPPIGEKWPVPVCTQTVKWILILSQVLISKCRTRIRNVLFQNKKIINTPFLNQNIITKRRTEKLDTK